MSRPWRTPRAILMFCLLVCATVGTDTHAQSIDMDAVRAEEELRWGVTAYHRGLFSEAVRSLEVALSYQPDNLRIVEWLGFAYYRLGIEDTALSLWRRLVAAEKADATLRYLIETVEYRRGIESELSGDRRYVNAFELLGTRADHTLFLRPTSVYPRTDGGFYVASFAGNEVIRFNANAAVSRRFLGGVSGLDHPFDVVETTDGYVFISEFLRHAIFRSDIRGQQVLRFGEKGSGDGELLAPQYLTVDDRGYLYVTESGNRRVSKFDYDGNFVLSFGRPTDTFPGFSNPTGIVYHDDALYVCDQRLRCIRVFDTSGNYLGTLAEGELESPEGLSVYEPRRLLLADTVDLKLIDLERETVRSLTDETGRSIRMTKAVVDANDQIVVSDFARNSVSILTEIASIYSGLLVEIERIDASDFPTIWTAVRVETRDGEPLVGLDESNFVLTERSGSVGTYEIVAPEPDAQARISLVVEDPAPGPGGAEAILEAVETLTSIIEPYGGASLYLAGEIPVLAGTGAAGRRRLATQLEATGEGEATEPRLDSAIKLAGNELTAFPGSRAVVLVTSGALGSGSFAEYPPDVLAAFLRNNGIRFFCIHTDPDPPDREVFEYLCEETGGESLYLFRPKGVGEIAERVIEAPTGRYFLRYTSASRSDFGDAYIPIQVEALYYRRTGRGASAYYPPVEY